MFQTEINHFFQSFASDNLTSFMRFITGLGYMEFFMLFLITLMLAINFKKGFLMFMVLLWTAAITFFFKDYFDLPRPFHVDNTVQLLDGDLPDHASFEFSKRGATSFWEPLPEDVLVVTRQSAGVENGFPSGHSSIAITFWAALALLYRKRWLWLVSIALMLLIPFSRIYLGVHFLADVLAGIALGGILLGVFYKLFLQPNKLSSFLEKDHYTIGLNPTTAILLASPLLFMLILPPKIYILLAFMLGFGLGFLLLSQKGLPIDKGTWFQRIGRTIMGLLAFAAVGYALKFITGKTGLEGNLWLDFIRYTASALTLVWLGTELNIRLGLFNRDTTIA